MREKDVINIDTIKKIRSDNKRLTEIIRFLFVGGIATVIDFLVMGLIMYLPNTALAESFVEFLLCDYQIETWLVVFANAIGFIVGLIFNYVFSILLNKLIYIECVFIV